MASISHLAFEFHRNMDTDGQTQIIAVAKKGTGAKKFYTLDLKTGRATKPLGDRWTNVPLPRKMAAAMIHACVIFSRDNPGLREIWKPRWPV